MTKDEAKAYALKIAKESGMDEATTTQIAAAFDNDKFFNGFVPRPEVDRALDSERGKYRDVHARNEYLEKEWLPSAKQAESQAKSIVAKYNKYVQTYGDIDESDPASVRSAAMNTGMTEDKIRELLSRELGTALSARDQATLDLMEIREDYMERFKKRLPMKDFERQVAEARKTGNNDSLSAIYRDWVAPELDKMTPHRFSDDELKARDKRLAEDAVKDFASRNRVPVDARPREAHMLLDNAKLRAEKDKANGSAQSGRDAFLEVMADPDADTVRQRYPV